MFPNFATFITNGGLLSMRFACSAIASVLPFAANETRAQILNALLRRGHRLLLGLLLAYL